MIAGIFSILGKCMSSLLYLLYATSLLEKAYKEVWPNLKPYGVCHSIKIL